jgi:rhodanese-related sulfurtransferase
VAEVQRAADRYVGEPVEAISAAELLARLESDELVLLDVRPGVEFESGHIAGARSFPIDELEERLAQLPHEAEVVAYCRGPFCAFADEAVRTLNRSGRRARRLEGGWPEWKLAGAPVAGGG